MVIAAIMAWPIGAAVWDALHRESALVPADREFVGLDTLLGVITSASWWSAFGFSAAVAAVAVAVQLVLGLGAAGVVHRLAHGHATILALTLVPWAIAPVVAGRLVFDAYSSGVLASWFGRGFSDDMAAVAAFTSVEIWRGSALTTVLVLLLRSRRATVLDEALRADGVGVVNRWRLAVLPSLAPTLLLIGGYRGLATVTGFETAQSTVGDTTTHTVTTLVWQASFERFEVGLAAALSLWLLVGFAAVATAATWFMVRGGER